jgi:LysM repeat protein
MKFIIFAALLPLIFALPTNLKSIRQAVDDTCEDPCRIITTRTIRSGDTLTTITVEYNSTITAIVYVNPEITDPDFITQDQVIQIPASTCNDVAPALPENPPATAPCAAPGSDTVYTVVAGDTLTKIAKNYAITLDSLIAANPQIENPDVSFFLLSCPCRLRIGVTDLSIFTQAIEVGDQINIPTCGTCAPEGTETTYTVVSGDTLTKIAGEHGITLYALEAANPQIENPDIIDIGDVIKLPICGSI